MTKMKNYWEYYPTAQGACQAKSGKMMVAHFPGCSEYEVDTYKYPKV